MPARKNRQRRAVKHTKPKNKNRSKKYLVLILVFVFLGLILVFLHRSTKYWSGEGKLRLVSPAENGDVVISVFDPELDDITTVIVPGNTQIKVARQMGIWKTRSLWKLGFDEGLGGKLLAESLTHHMKLPVVAWGDEEAIGFSSQSVIQIVKTALLMTNTNLTFGDRIKIALFAFGIQNTNMSTIDLRNTAYLSKTILPDGEEGYVVADTLPQKVAVIFSQESISKEGTRIRIIDRTINSNIAEELGETLQVAGGKITSITNESSDNTDCVVVGSNKFTVDYVADMFDCTKNYEKTANFDLEITIGEEFAKRF
ncbi:hypothetical protein IPM62_02830 [Candidatus Woesebacteria bacterium]|nr:MAG: hypothetical protein IPM62_02830 [Candidatus Woesebacteria bacterium]